ncbi:TetR/AcrR family transcriptional regulator [Actinomadura sp. KC345]|nr:TetR/AcrR family transcriptional regulator [Actinomadura sp. KC345]
MSVLDLARQWFIQGRRIDMGELGAELGVSRATLFRWVGNRDQLTADILRDLATKTFHRALAAHADTTGATRVSAVIGDFVQILAETSFFVDFVHREPERALRLLTTKESPVQGYAIERVEQLLDEEIDPPSGPEAIHHHDLAYLIIRICESLLYTDLITGDPPNPDIARQAIYALIR